MHETANGRSDLEQFDESIGAGKSLSQIGFELRLEEIASGNAAVRQNAKYSERANNFRFAPVNGITKHMNAMSEK
jgi:hypothetical protein